VHEKKAKVQHKFMQHLLLISKSKSTYYGLLFVIVVCLLGIVLGIYDADCIGDPICLLGIVLGILFVC
jgi:hypothetical protein